MMQKTINTIKKLSKELYKIECQNWIKSRSNGTGAAGHTLELLLGKKLDAMALPDYIEVEIKSRNTYSNHPLHLFCLTFDNQALEIERLFKIGSYPSNNQIGYRALCIRVNALDYKICGYYKYKIFVDYNEEKVKLIIYNTYSSKKITEMSWSFYAINSRLIHKLKYMVLVNVLRDRKRGEVYYRYINPKFYELKGLKEFLLLIETGEISITFKLTQKKDENGKLKIVDRGTSFDIDVNSIDKLFNDINIEKI